MEFQFQIPAANEAGAPEQPPSVTSLFHPIVRQLVNEASGTFLAVQKLSSDPASMQMKLVKLSRQYRSIVRACVEKLNVALDKDRDSEVLKRQAEIFSKIEFMWHFCEIALIDVMTVTGLKGGSWPVLSQLIEWIQLHFTSWEAKAHTLITEGIGCDCNGQQYWDCVLAHLMQGRISSAASLLSLHSKADSSAFISMEQVLDAMPQYMVNNKVTTTEFDLQWQNWQMECQTRLEEGHYSSDSNLEFVAALLSGEEQTLYEAVQRLNFTWYEALTGYLLFSEPTVRLHQLRDRSDRVIGIMQGKSQESVADGGMDNFILAVMDTDMIEAVKYLQSTLDNPWFAAHIIDLVMWTGIFGTLGTAQHKNGEILRDQLVNELATQLSSHSSLWEIGILYFSELREDKTLVAQWLEKVPVNSDAKANKVVAMAKRYDCHRVAENVRRAMSRRHLAEDRLGSALAWAIKSEDAVLTSDIADKFLEEYKQTGNFPATDIIDNLGSHMLLCDHLIFLGKFREFHVLYNNQQYSEAGALLVSLVSSRLTPKDLLFVLLWDAYPLLEAPNVILDSTQTYELLNGLEEFTYSELGHSKEKNGIAALKSDKEQLIRLALSRNLARAFIKEGNVAESEGDTEELRF